MYFPAGTYLPVEECSTAAVCCSSVSVPVRTNPMGLTAGTGEVLFSQSVTAERSGLTPVERMHALKMSVLLYHTFIPCLSP